MAFALGTSFVTVLHKVGATDIQVDEDGEWITFRLDELNFEAGTKRGNWLITASLAQLSTDPAKLDEVRSVIEAANAELPASLAPAKMREGDCYLQIATSVPLATMTSPLGVLRMEKHLGALRKLAQHDVVATITGRYRQW
jgi:hypothetical protein